MFIITGFDENNQNTVVGRIVYSAQSANNFKELIERAIVLLFLLFMDHLTQSAHVSECVIRFDAATLCEFIFVDFICMRHMLIDYILLVPHCRQYSCEFFSSSNLLNCPKIK